MRSRIPQLDGVRGVAILLVLAWHYAAGPLGMHAGRAHSGTLGRGPLALTWSGVDLFFVLSGFLIADILLRARAADNYFAVFFARRTTRLVPLYFLALAAFVVARERSAGVEPLRVMFDEGGVPLWTYPLFLQNLGMARAGGWGPGWLAPTWSLAVEWQFYLTFPLLVRFAPPRMVPVAAAAAVLGCPVLRDVLMPTAGYVLLPSRADAFLAGVLAAYLLWDPAAARRVEARLPWLRAAWWGLLAGVGVMAYRLEWFGAVTGDYGTLTHSLLAAFYGTTVLLTVADERWWLNRVMRLRPLRWVGVVSYGVYLIHQPMNYHLHAALRGTPPGIADSAGVATTLLAVVATLGLASVLFLTVETWFIDLGRRAKFRFGGRRPAAPQPVEAAATVP